MWCKGSFRQFSLPLGWGRAGLLTLGLLLIISSAAWSAAAPAAPDLKSAAADSPKSAQIKETYGRLPLYFIENRGQADPRVKFFAMHQGQTTWFTQEGVGVTLEPQSESAVRERLSVKRRPYQASAARNQAAGVKAATVLLTPVGLRRGVIVAALERQEHKVNYFIGNDPKKWVADVPTYQAVVYREAYQGIDLKFYGQGRQLEYDVIVRPGADPNQVKFRYAGIKRLEVTKEGDLALHLPQGGVLLQKKPYIYQEIAGVRVARAGKFRLEGDVAGHTYGFEVAAYDKSRPLVIDPKLDYSTYLGGSGIEVGTRIAVDAAGCAYVAGVTTSRLADPRPFPQQNPLSDALGGGGPVSAGWACVFVSKFNARGDGLIYSTYLAGKTQNDEFSTPAKDIVWLAFPHRTDRIGLAVDGAGCAYVTGPTMTKDFPTTAGAPYLTPLSWDLKVGTAEGFVTKLTAAGNGLAYSTYMRTFSAGPNDSHTWPHAVAVDPGTKEAYVVGESAAEQFNGQLGIAGHGSHVPFVTKLNSTGTAFLWTRTLGTAAPLLGREGIAYGAASEPYDATTTPTGGVWVTGMSRDPYFPLVNPLQGFTADVDNAFVTWLDASGNVRFSTFWGATSGSQDWTMGLGIARGPDGAIHVAGETENPGFQTYAPSGTPLQTTYGGGDMDGVYFKFRQQWTWNVPSQKWVHTGVSKAYSTFLGGDYADVACEVAVDRQGSAYLTGSTISNNFPLKNPISRTGGGLVFVTKFAADGTTMNLEYSTRLGGGAENGYAIAVDAQGCAYVTGVSGDVFPLVHPFQNTVYGPNDAFVLKIGKSIPMLGPLQLLLLQ